MHLTKGLSKHTNINRLAYQIFNCYNMYIICRPILYVYLLQVRCNNLLLYTQMSFYKTCIIAIKHITLKS